MPKKYDLKTLRGDIIGGVTVAVVALPLALALGVASGAGAKAGLYSAIITGIISTFFGGTRAQINGPTGAMTVVLISVYEKLGLEGLFAAMFVAALIQILAGIFKLGKFIHLIPRPVIIGFTNGIGILIFIEMLKYFKTAPILGAITLIIVVGLPFLTKKIPATLVALIVGTLVCIYLLPTDAVVGVIPGGLPKFSIPSFPLDTFPLILKTGITLALLGSIESLLSAVIIDEMTQTKHKSNQELIGQGIGNLIATCFGAIIGTGAIVRSAVNVNSGGRTKLSGILHGFILLVITLQFSNVAAIIPLAVLGGILMGTAVRMIEFTATRQFLGASYHAGIVIAVTTVLTVVMDLTIAVLLGTVVAMFFFVTNMGKVYLKKYDVDHSGLSRTVMSFTVEGPLFFGVSNAIVSNLEIEGEDADIIILNLMNSPVIDTSGATALKNIRDLLKNRGQILYLAGIDQEDFNILKRFNVVEDEEYDLFQKRIGEVIEFVKHKYGED